jgi:hypothetical protein
MRLPRELTSYPKAVSRHSWPRPLEVASSFRIARTSASVSCPKEVLASMPPDGVYVVVAEYTDPPPKGIPSPKGLGRRPDLSHLDIRPAEVECWDNGLSGAAEFLDHGRAFRVEVLLGARVTAARRQKALDALASLRLGA